MSIKKIILSFFLFCPLWLQAQFVTVDWESSRGDSLLPVCTSVVDLPSDYRSYTYSAHIEYPEYQKMTSGEVKLYMLKTKYGELPESPSLECYVSVQAKTPQLDIAFLPIVMRGGDYYRLNSYKLVVDCVPCAMQRTSATRSTNERYVSNSVLAQGKWVRISVKDNGVHKITDGELKKMGFQNPSAVRLFGYGGHILPEEKLENLPDDLQEIPLWRENGYVLFYAKGVVKWKYEIDRFVHEKNVYSKYGCYFLTEGGTPLTFPSEKIEKKTSAVITEFPDYAVIDNDKKSHCQYGRILVDDKTLNRNSYDFPISGVSNKNGTLDISVATNGLAKSQIYLYIGDKVIGNYTINANEGYEIGKIKSEKFSIKDLLVDNASIDVVRKAENSSVEAYLDYIRINYTRKLALYGSQTAFRGGVTAADATFEIDGCNANTRVWDISSAVPCEMKGVLSGNRYSVVAQSGVDKELVALDIKGQFPSVEFVEEVANQDLHSIEQADMIIIIPSNGLFKSAAGKLANAHREMDGITVEIVTAQQVYNEFSSGTPDVTAYRRFMKMLYDRAATSSSTIPKYLLLFGDSWYDNRLITLPHLKQEDYLLCYESVNSVDAVHSYVLEDYMGLLDDGEGANHKRDKLDIGVGRIPVTSATTAHAIVDKIISYMRNDKAGAWQNVVALLGDDGDDNQHMKDAEGIAKIMNEQYPSFIVDRIYWDDFAAEKTATGLRYPEVTKAIRNRLDKGALVVNYSGHGSANLLSHEMSWKASDMAELKSPRIPLWVTASCDIGPFDKGENSVAETALANSVGGAVGLFTTTRTVLQGYNAILNKEFMKVLLSPVNGGSAVAVGDAVRMAKCNVISLGSDITDNKLQYVLLGDPALRLKLPEYRIRVDKVNGADVGTPVQASAGGVFSVKGCVVTRDGAVADDFKGLLYATMFDCIDSVKTLDNSTDGSFEYAAYNKMLFSGNDSVKNGHFEISIPVPMDISYDNENGMLNFFAVDSARVRSAQGYFEEFTVGGTADGIENDGKGPEIKLYLNTPSFVDGDEVNSNPCLWVELYDENGINTVGSGVGHNITAVVDNNPVHTYNLNSLYTPAAGDYRRGTIMLPLNTLDAGEHTLMLRAWDLYNNSSVATITFVVEPNLLPDVMEFKIEGAPVMNGKTSEFVIVHNRPQSEIEVVIDLYTIQGQLVWRKEERVVCDGLEYRCSWSGTADGDRPLSTGVYVARAYVVSDNGVAKPKRLKFVVVNNKK